MRGDGMRCGNRLPDSTGSTDPVEKILVVSTGVPLRVRVRLYIRIQTVARDRESSGEFLFGIAGLHAQSSASSQTQHRWVSAAGAGDGGMPRMPPAGMAQGRVWPTRAPAAGGVCSGALMHRGASWPAACWPAPAVIRETTVTLL